MINIWTQKHTFGFTVGDWVYWDKSTMQDDVYEYFVSTNNLAAKVLCFYTMEDYYEENSLSLQWIVETEDSTGYKSSMNCRYIKKVTKGYKAS